MEGKETMRTRSRSYTRLARPGPLLVLFAVCAFTQDSGDKLVGVWKMHAAASDFPAPNPPAALTMSIEKRGPASYQTIFDIVDKDGKKTRNESLRTFDGKWRPVENQPGLTQSCEVLDANTLRCTWKQNEKVVSDALARFSEDGRTQFVQRTIFGKDGRPSSGVVVYEKQVSHGS